eukprot:2538760-Pleurochrysis_carterae.AAC.1
MSIASLAPTPLCRKPCTAEKTWSLNHECECDDFRYNANYQMPFLCQRKQSEQGRIWCKPPSGADVFSPGCPSDFNVCHNKGPGSGMGRGRGGGSGRGGYPGRGGGRGHSGDYRRLGGVGNGDGQQFGRKLKSVEVWPLPPPPLPPYSPINTSPMLPPSLPSATAAETAAATEASLTQMFNSQSDFSNTTSNVMAVQTRIADSTVIRPPSAVPAITTAPPAITTSLPAIAADTAASSTPPSPSSRSASVSATTSASSAASSSASSAFSTTVDDPQAPHQYAAPMSLLSTMTLACLFPAIVAVAALL